MSSSPFIVVGVVIERLNVITKRLNVVAECQSHARVAVVGNPGPVLGLPWTLAGMVQDWYQ